MEEIRRARSLAPSTLKHVTSECALAFPDGIAMAGEAQTAAAQQPLATPSPCVMMPNRSRSQQMMQQMVPAGTHGGELSAAACNGVVSGIVPTPQLARSRSGSARAEALMEMREELNGKAAAEREARSRVAIRRVPSSSPLMSTPIGRETMGSSMPIM